MLIGIFEYSITKNKPLHDEPQTPISSSTCFISLSLLSLLSGVWYCADPRSFTRPYSSFIRYAVSHMKVTIHIC